MGIAFLIGKLETTRDLLPNNVDELIILYYTLKNSFKC